MSARKVKHRPLPWDGKEMHEWPDHVLARVPWVIANRIDNLRHRGAYAPAGHLQHNATFWEAVGRYVAAGAGYGGAIEMAHLDLNARGLSAKSPPDPHIKAKR